MLSAFRPIVCDDAIVGICNGFSGDVELAFSLSRFLVSLQWLHFCYECNGKEISPVHTKNMFFTLFTHFFTRPTGALFDHYRLYNMLTTYKRKEINNKTFYRHDEEAFALLHCSLMDLQHIVSTRMIQLYDLTMHTFTMWIHTSMTMMMFIKYKVSLPLETTRKKLFHTSARTEIGATKGGNLQPGHPTHYLSS